MKDDVAAWVGRRSTAQAWLDPAQADRMNATLDREPSFRPGDELPPAWHWLYFAETVRAGELGVEGHPRLGLRLPPVGLPRRMWAGGTLTFRRPLLLATTVEQVSTIRAVTPKQGRSGPLVFVTVEHALRELRPEGDDGDSGDRGDAGAAAVIEEQTIVYRPAPPPDTAPPDPPPTDPAPTDPAPGEAAFSRSWVLNNVALFRYSALTFNGHRIHYDADYCRDVEGYPGPVVHGPLLATLLLDLAAEHRRPLGRFSYTARSPLFLPEPFTVSGRPDGEATRLWVTGPGGRTAMQARAQPR
jgi:3-methylfumaryl-CoA hydratase